MRIATLGIVLLALSAPAFTQSQAEPPVKKSEQGICHERGTATYKRTIHFEAFDSMDTCLASGGRIAKNAPAETSWMGSIGKKLFAVIGILVTVGGAFLISRRRSGGSSQAASQDEIERKRWEGNSRE